MGRIFVVELEGRAYRCKFCKTNLALADDLVSRVLSFLYFSLFLWVLDIICFFLLFFPPSVLWNIAYSLFMIPATVRWLNLGCNFCFPDLFWEYLVSFFKNRRILLFPPEFLNKKRITLEQRTLVGFLLYPCWFEFDWIGFQMPLIVVQVYRRFLLQSLIDRLAETFSMSYTLSCFYNLNLHLY